MLYALDDGKGRNYVLYHKNNYLYLVSDFNASSLSGWPTVTVPTTQTPFINRICHACIQQLTVVDVVIPLQASFGHFFVE